MSQEYEGQDLGDIAKQAEQDLNSNAMKQGTANGSDSSAFLHPDPILLSNSFKPCVPSQNPI